MGKFPVDARGGAMREVSYTEARQSFARLLDRVTEGREIVLIRRRGRERCTTRSQATAG
jgi:PHD/YefM family antitoxin component YafN of YafNO toxin-antitoxin module